jgi:uncharacterized SAM-binding protein YcdF (DUF218 family)
MFGCGKRANTIGLTVHNRIPSLAIPVVIQDGRFMRVYRLTWRGALTPIFISLLFAIAWVEHTTLLRGAATWWVISDSLDEPADAIVVLGGGYGTRAGAAADLYKRDLGKRILIVNPEIEKPEIWPTPQDRTFAELHKLGVPTASLVNLRNGVSNTYEEALSVLDWAMANGAKNVIVPTECFHTRRVRWIFAKELAAAGINVKVYAINQPFYSPEDWWRHKEGWAAFLSEILKYLFYRVKY